MGVHGTFDGDLGVDQLVWLVTDMYSPVPIEKAPATSPARPVSTMVWEDTPLPPTPAMSEALVTSPSTAPNTVGRSHPPETSRCR